MERRVVFIAAVVFVAFGSRFANGYPFTWKLSGHVVDVYSCCDSSPTPVSDPALADLGVVAGAPFSATITLDSLTPDTDPSPSFGQYLGAVLEMAFTAGSFHASAGPAPSSGDLVINVGLQALIADAAQSDGADTLFDNPLLALQVVGAPGTFTQAIPVHPPPVSSLQPFNLHDPLLGIASSFGVLGSDGGPLLQIQSQIETWVVPEPEVDAVIVALVLAVLAARSPSTAAEA